MRANLFIHSKRTSALPRTHLSKQKPCQALWWQLLGFESPLYSSLVDFVNPHLSQAAASLLLRSSLDFPGAVPKHVEDCWASLPSWVSVTLLRAQASCSENQAAWLPPWQLSWQPSKDPVITLDDPARNSVLLLWLLFLLQPDSTRPKLQAQLYSCFLSAPSAHNSCSGPLWL